MRVSIYNKGVSYNGETVKSPLPKESTTEAAAVDVSTPVPFVLEVGAKHLVDTGLIIKAPRGYCIQVLPRSGLACKKGITIPNAPGLIDRDYCGPDDVIKIMLVNQGNEAVEFKAGDRVAQLLFTPYITVSWDEEEKATFAKVTSRGGFGSTGVDRKSGLWNRRT